MYEKLAGMTGTPATEADELFDIYKLDVVEIPTNQPVGGTRTTRSIARRREIRRDPRGDRRANKRLQPVLVGTASIEKSEVLAEFLKKNGYKQIEFGNENAMEKHRTPPRAPASRKMFAVLNARFHEQEAASSPRPGALARSRSPPAEWPAAAPTSARLADMRIQQETGDMFTEAEKADEDRAAGRHRSFREIVLKAEGDRRSPSPAPKGAARRRSRPGGLLHHRHRAPREPPHRQPAARPFRPSGRPRPLEVLPVARRRPDAHLRLGPARLHAAAPRPEGRRGDHPSLDQQGAGEGAAEGRARNFDIRKNC